jgi:formylmethanofuran dehydrogenase subunit E
MRGYKYSACVWLCWALQKLGIEDPRGRDRKRLFTFVGIDRWLTDAVAVVTGFPAWNNARSGSATGELEATFVDVETARGIRVTVQQLSKALAQQMALNNLFTIQWVKVGLPPEELPGPKANKLCESCGGGSFPP